MIAGLLFLFLWVPDFALAQGNTHIQGEVMYADKKNGDFIVERQVKVTDAQKGVAVTCQYLEVQLNPKNQEILKVKAHGRVQVTRNQEYAYFDRGEYQRNLSLIIAEGHLVVGTDQMKLEGHRGTYDVLSKKGVLFPLPNHQVHFLFHKKNPKKPGQLIPVTGVADEITIFEDLDKLILQGHVQVDDETEPSHIKAGRLVAWFGEDKKLESMIASGGFRMTQPGRSSSASRAIFVYESQLIVLTGKATVRQVLQGEVQGERIEMHMDAKKGLVKGHSKKALKIEIPLR